MTPSRWELIAGDSRERLADLDDGSIDAVVTDPPYELGFMGKSWDASGVAYDVALWAEVLRVLKPGGHLLAFGGTRTYHRMACAIEDAGFEIRDSIHWLYGSGFPKSLDVSKAIDKAAGAEREVVGTRTDVATRIYDMGKGAKLPSSIPVTAPATPEAARWDGWGTALKPAHEPVVVARKPLVGTVAANVLEYGTGVLNIDGCRIGTDGGTSGCTAGPTDGIFGDGLNGAFGKPVAGLGRWPANVVLDANAAAELDRQSGESSSPAKPFDYVRTTSNSKYGKDLRPEGQYVTAANYGDSGGASRFFYRADHTDDDLTSFRYVPKPDRAERNAGLDGMSAQPVHRYGAGIGEGQDPSAPSIDRNFHPTVKPIDLMRWLVRLVTPPDGTVLDPFAGSGTTLVAATLEHRHSIGIELTDDYHPIIRNRCTWAEHRARFGPLTGPTNATAEPITPTLFDEDGAA